MDEKYYSLPVPVVPKSVADQLEKELAQHRAAYETLLDVVSEQAAQIAQLVMKQRHESCSRRRCPLRK